MILNFGSKEPLFAVDPYPTIIKIPQTALQKIKPYPFTQSSYLLRICFMINLILVEDYSIIRAGLRMLLNKFGDINIVAEASSGEKAIELAKEFEPDIVLMDIELSEMGGLEATAQIKASNLATNVLILSNYISENYVVQAIQAGAKGYVKKDAHISEIREAIDIVMDGGAYFAPEVSTHMMNYICRDTEAKPSAQHSKCSREPSADTEMQNLDLLTARQIEILILISKGMSTRQIAQQMHISHKTVEAHRANIMKRLDIFHVAGLTKFALDAGLIDS